MPDSSISRLSNRPSWSNDVQIVGQEQARRAGPPSAVNATLDLGDHFYIRASGLEARLAGQLTVHSEPGEPLNVTGIIAAQDALFDAYGQHFASGARHGEFPGTTG